jgi:hypothetical protein
MEDERTTATGECQRSLVAQHRTGLAETSAPLLRESHETAVPRRGLLQI